MAAIGGWKPLSCCSCFIGSGAELPPAVQKSNTLWRSHLVTLLHVLLSICPVTIQCFLSPWLRQQLTGTQCQLGKALPNPLCNRDTCVFLAYSVFIEMTYLMGNWQLLSCVSALENHSVLHKFYTITLDVRLCFSHFWQHSWWLFCAWARRPNTFMQISKIDPMSSPLQHSLCPGF